jgi:predicted permease
MSLGRSLRYGWRRLRTAPAFAAFSVITLALAIGATTAVYSLIHVVTGPPPGIAGVDRIVEVYHYPTGSVPTANLAWEDYQDLRARQSVFESVTGWTWFRASIVAGGYAETTSAEIVDGDYFRTLGVRMQVGRALQPQDDRAEAPAVIVISDSLWQRRFASAIDIVGKTVKVGGTTFEIVGVADGEFKGLFNGGLITSQVWVPMHAARRAFPELHDQFAPNSRDRRWVFVRARLASGRTISQAMGHVATIGKQLDAAFPIGLDTDPRFRSPHAIARPWGVRALSSRVMGVPAPVMRLIAGTTFGAVVLVLLVACTNLANLMLARNIRRRGEMGTRVALGASRPQLVLESIAEPLMLAIAGGAAGMGVARVLMKVLSTEVDVTGGVTLQVLPRLDPATLAAGSCATLFALFVAGVVPVLQSTRVDLRSVLAADGGGTVARWRGRRYLIVMQVSVSVLLVAVATLYAGEMRRQSRIDTGMDLERLALAQVDFGSQRYDEERARQVADHALRQMAMRPGVAAVSVSSGLPAGLATNRATLTPADASRPADVAFVAGTPGVFDTLGIGILRGRAFDGRDTPGRTPVVLLSEIAAQQLFPGGDPIGREVIFERRRVVGESERPPVRMTVIGVTADTDAIGVGRRAFGVAYLPLDQHYESRLVLAARVGTDPHAFVGPLRAAIATVDPDLAVVQIGTGLALAGPDTTFPRIVSSSASLLGLTALVLALAGLSGVLSQVVAGRTREIGVRLALGAGAPAIRRMVIAEGLRPVLMGLIAGLGFGLIARAALQPFFLRLVPATDVTLMILLPALFLGAGFLACYAPAHRASRIDPNVALRNL